MSVIDAVARLRAAHRNRTGQRPAIVRLGVNEQQAILTELDGYTDLIHVKDEGPPLLLERVSVAQSGPLLCLHGMAVESVLQASLLEVGTRGRWPKWTGR